MKHALITSVTLLFVVSASAVVGGPEPGEGELAITSEDSTASGTTSVGPNGTEFSSKIEMEGRESNISTGEKVEKISFSEDKTSFDGFIEAPTPCHVIDQETTEDGSSYTINIKTVVENESQPCAQQVVLIKYSGSFEAETPYKLELKHNNQTAETIEREDIAGPDPKDSRKKGIISSVMNWINSLF